MSLITPTPASASRVPLRPPAMRLFLSLPVLVVVLAMVLEGKSGIGESGEFETRKLEAGHGSGVRAWRTLESSGAPSVPWFSYLSPITPPPTPQGG